MIAAWVATISLLEDNEDGLLYCDNTPVQAVINNGSSSSKSLNTLAHLYWISCASKKLDVMVYRVSSKNNIADGPSRNITTNPTLGRRICIKEDPNWPFKLI